VAIHLQRIGTILSPFFLEVGVGSSIFFWHDRWCEEGPLRYVFPSLYVLVVSKDATIADYCPSGLGAVV